MAAQLHFLLIPLMSQSHIIPLTDFAKSLARRGALVSIVTTPLNAERYKSTVAGAAAQNLRIQMLPLPFPSLDSGLPEGCENFDSLASLDLALDFLKAFNMLRSPLQTLIQELNPKPNCIISSNAVRWSPEVAAAFRIPHYFFETVSCFTMHCAPKITSLVLEAEVVDSDSQVFTVPGVPHRVELTRNQLPPSAAKANRDLSLSRGTIVNSFQELEPWYVEALREERGNLWTVGPVSLSNRDDSERFGRGNEASIDEHYCLTWLDSMERKSVIYACFGSLCSLSLQQIKELGLGLEESGSPFVWIIRKQENTTSEEVGRWLEEEGLEERVRGKGLIVRGWAPQVMILSHPSVGGFLTHCGWNSTLEGICTGVPMLTWPMFSEQFYNEKMVVDVLDIGVRVGVESFVDKQGLVKRETVKLAVGKLMEESEEGMERRRRSEELAKMANEAFEEGGSSFMNTTSFVQDVVKVNSMVHGE